MAPRRPGHPPEVKKGGWSPEEDEVLRRHVQQHGTQDWSSIQANGLLNRSGKSCRLRWVNKLQPGLRRGKFSVEEEHVVLELQAEIGNRWAQIATHLPGRTDNDVKNFWSTRQKRLARLLLEPPPRRRGAVGQSRATSSSVPSLELRAPLPGVLCLPASVDEDAEPASSGAEDLVDAPLPGVRNLPDSVAAAKEPGSEAGVASLQYAVGQTCSSASSAPSRELRDQQEPSSSMTTAFHARTYDVGQSSRQQPSGAPLTVDATMEMEPDSYSKVPFGVDLASLHYTAFVEPMAGEPTDLGDAPSYVDVEPLEVNLEDPFSCLEDKYLAVASHGCCTSGGVRLDELSSETLAFFERPADRARNGSVSDCL